MRIKRRNQHRSNRRQINQLLATDIEKAHLKLETREVFHQRITGYVKRSNKLVSH